MSNDREMQKPDIYCHPPQSDGEHMQLKFEMFLIHIGKHDQVRPSGDLQSEQWQVMVRKLIKEGKIKCPTKFRRHKTSKL